MLRLCLFAAFVISVMSVPEDEVIPETKLSLSLRELNPWGGAIDPELKHATPKDAAHAKIKMMQAQGFDNTQCNQMATDAISGMTSTLQAEQDAMNALSTGADCLVTTPATRRLLSTGVSTAQGHLDAAAVALVAAKADLAAKKATLQANKIAPITLTINLDTIGTDMTAIGAAVAADPAVVAAKQAVTDAQTIKDNANLVVVQEQATYETSLIAAQDSSTECLCNAKDAHDLAWPSAQKVVTDNTQAWKEAHHVKCAVDGSADDACAVPAFTVTDKPLVAEAANVVCTSAPTPAPTAAPTEAPTEAPPTDVVKVGNVCYRKKMAKGMCQKKWQDTGGCNGKCVSADQCATLINGFNPKCDGFLKDRGNYNGKFCSCCSTVEDSTLTLGGGNNNYDVFEFVTCP